MSKIVAALLLALPIYGMADAAEPAIPNPAVLKVDVDLRDAPRKLLHAHLQIPVTSRSVTLEYPQWIPGNHRPTGPIDNLAGLFVRAQGKDLAWRRDSVDMYAIHVEVPAGVSVLDVSLDFMAVAGSTGASESGSTSQNMTVLEWNSVVMYPANIPVAQILVAASLMLPASWKFGTALTPTGEASDKISFRQVSMETLVDSPVIAGRYFREFPLAPEITPKHYLDVAGEAAEDVELKPAYLDSISRLVREAGKLYASRHYETYHFLLSLSDVVRPEGLEHHQSSDNGIPEHGVSDPKVALLEADLLPHEFTHSWNGKYRRPAGLATLDYKTPMRGDLLWVYEGMTQYWGMVLAARSGLTTPEETREVLAQYVAGQNFSAGRTWRNVEDTAIAGQILRGESRHWSNWRRSQDYYIEGALLWLDADTIIRSQTHGQKSLDDFAAAFLGVGGNTPAKVVPYGFDDVVKGLNGIAAYDWRAFLTDKITNHRPEIGVAGIERGGYKLVDTDTPSSFTNALLARYEGVDASMSLGIRVGKEGEIGDVEMNSLGFKAGLNPGMKIVAVNGHAYSKELLTGSLRRAKGTTEPMELITSDAGEFRTIRLDYHGGERYLKLERVNDKPALLDDILKPLTSSSGPSGKSQPAGR